MLIESIKEKVQKPELVQQAFSQLLARSRAYIFELVAEVRLDKISRENISEIERLQLFSYFLTDFIMILMQKVLFKKIRLKL